MNWTSLFLQTNLYLVLFFAFYQFFLRKETFHSLNRLYLVGTPFLAFLIPLGQSEWVHSWFITEQIQTQYSVALQPFYLIVQKPQPNEFAWQTVLTWIYFTGVIVFSLHLLFKLMNVFQYLKSPQQAAAFSFFNTIVIDAHLEKKSTILAHETVHVRQLHSLDVLFFEVLHIFCWFNPVVYLYKKSVQQVHEFIADEIAAQTEGSKANYALLLLSKEFGIKNLPLTNTFFEESLLKKRIKMLAKPRSEKIALLKYGFSIPLFIVMLIFSSASIAGNKNTFANENIQNRALTQAQSVKINSSLPVDTLEPKKKKAAVNKSDEVFSVVEVNPQFPGGVKKMYDWLGTVIVYPEIAQKEKIHGKVFVKFVVTKTGKIGDITILKGIGGGCDEEAIRVVRLMPTWKPGYQNGMAVDVFYTMPIVFQLE